MHRTTKIATCCYCGTRAMLELRGDLRHELACASCGAPLHNLKMLRTADVGKPERTKAKRAAQPKSTRAPVPLMDERRKKKTYKKRKTKKLVKEIFDLFDDIFD